MRLTTLAVLLPSLALSVSSQAPAHSSPAMFPDIDSLHPVASDLYHVAGAHPSSSGWAFSTPSGQRCQDSMIAELGVACWGPVSGAASGSNFVTVSLTREGSIDHTTTDSEGVSYPLLPVGSQLATDNGVVCGVLSETSYACRSRLPASWPSDTADPPDRHYAEHGFVIAPDGNWTY